MQNQAAPAAGAAQGQGGAQGQGAAQGQAGGQQQQQAQPQPAAGARAQVRAAPQPQALTLTFADRYALTDPYGGDYRRVMNHFALPAGGAANWNAGALTNAVVGIENAPNAYIGLFADGVNDEGRVRLVHCPLRFQGLLGSTSVHIGRTFVMLDEIVGTTASFVEFPANAMTLCPTVRVPTDLAGAATLWNADPTADVIDPVTGNNGRAVQVPLLMYVPPVYIPQFMDKQLSPRELVTIVLPIVEADTRTGQLQPFVDWCLAAGVADHTGGDHSELLLPALSAPVADAEFLEWSRSIIERLLPDAVTASANASTVAAARIANIMTDVLAEQRAQRQEAQDARLRASSPRSVSEFFKEHGTIKLMSLARVSAEDDLPELWGAVAAATSKRDREAIEMVFRENANKIGIPELCPVVTPSLAKKITSLRLAGTNLEDLEEGVHPFAMVIMDHSTTSGEAAFQAAVEASHDYDDLMAGGGHADLTDLKTIKNSKVLIPETFELARAMLQAFKVALLALLGEDHDVVKEYDRFLTAYINRESFFVGRLRRCDPTLGPARLLRYVQLAMRAWFQGVWEAPTTNAANAVRHPPLREILDKMMMSDLSWLPLLPERYTQTKDPTDGPKKDKNPAKEKPSQVINRDRDARFDDFKLKIQNTKFNDAIQRVGKAPPTVKRNGEDVALCASYHLRGVCFSNCSRRATHNKLNATETDALYGWCQLAFE